MIGRLEAFGVVDTVIGKRLVNDRYAARFDQRFIGESHIGGPLDVLKDDVIFINERLAEDLIPGPVLKRVE